MALTWEEITDNAIRFSHRWRDAAREEGQAQPFTLEFIKVFGIADPLAAGEFEARVNLDDGHNGFIDYFWPKKIAIEMKSPGKDLKKAYEQLKNYVVHLAPAAMPELLMVSDFTNIHLYHRTSGRKVVFKLKDLRKHIREFASLAGYEVSRNPEAQLEVNVRAAEKMAGLHDALLEYGYAGHNLELILSRILFCLFAEDTGIFPKNAFLDYVANSREDGGDLAGRLEKLFEVLNMPPEEREKRKGLSPALLQFQYINGGLFAELLPQADFDAKMRAALIACARFDWSKISPAIFGSIFQGVMDRQKRRELGAHYTSEENILKLINPLFMDELWAEFEKNRSSPGKLRELHKKIAALKFLDPACGCGNFLIIAYRELRRLELAILKMLPETGQKRLLLESFLKVGVHQFYGIELEEFPARIAQVGMWLMDHLMNMEAAEAFGGYYARLPLKQGAMIRHENALRFDWTELIAGEELSYILGNPPFSGSRIMSREQKEEVREFFKDSSGAGEIDYVACWFKKAQSLMEKYEHVKTAFVATNSIAQGLQASLVWNEIQKNGSHINFAWLPFKWQNEARGKAAVHCVIIGFNREVGGEKFIFDESVKIRAKNINPYLRDGENIFISPREKPIDNVPQMRFGSMPRDGGNFILSTEERLAILEKEPELSEVIRPYMGAEDFLHSKKRWCIWLHNAPLKLISKSGILKGIMEKVKNFRLASKAQATRNFAETPGLFAQIAHPYTDYLIIPRVSSEKRKYIPIGFCGEETIASDALQIVPNASLYHFGILTSSVHNAWSRAVAGRLKSDIRYSKDIVYNNFPWPQAAARQREKIAELAQSVLAARGKYPGSSLADLYDPLTMPKELLAAHQKLVALFCASMA